ARRARRPAARAGRSLAPRPGAPGAGRECDRGDGSRWPDHDQRGGVGQRTRTRTPRRDRHGSWRGARDAPADLPALHDHQVDGDGRRTGRRAEDHRAPRRNHHGGSGRAARRAVRRRAAGGVGGREAEPRPASPRRSYGATTCSSTGAVATEPCTRSVTITRTGNDPGAGIRIMRRLENVPSPGTASPRRPLSLRPAIRRKPMPLSICAVIRLGPAPPVMRAVIVSSSLPAVALSGERDSADTAGDPSAYTGRESRTGSET